MSNNKSYSRWYITTRLDNKNIHIDLKLDLYDKNNLEIN